MIPDLIVFFVKYSYRHSQIFIIKKEILRLSLAKGHHPEESNLLGKAFRYCIHFCEKALFS